MSVVPYTYSEDGIFLSDGQEEAGFLDLGTTGRYDLRTVHVNVIAAMRVDCHEVFAAINKREARDGVQTDEIPGREDLYALVVVQIIEIGQVRGRGRGRVPNAWQEGYRYTMLVRMIFIVGIKA